VAVEKLAHQKMAEKTLRQEALQATFATRVDIFHPRFFGCFEENGLFQQPQAMAQACAFPSPFCAMMSVIDSMTMSAPRPE
jgi:hypothetical protein